MDFDETLSEAVRRDSVRVPPYPTTAMRLQQVLAKADYTQAALVDAMRTDAVFTGNLLRLANSPFYRRGDAVTSLTIAVGRIGAKELTRLALAATVSTAAQAQGPLSELRRLVWRQALTSALVCEALAKADGDTDASEAFVAGLLHDAGKLLVLSSLEDAIAKTKGAGEQPADAWLSLLEKHHLGFGRVLAAKWQLPARLEAVIANHHDESPDELSQRVAVSDRVVEALEQHASLDEAAVARLTGLGPSAAQALAKVLPTIPGTIAAFEHDAQDSGDTLVRDKAPVEPPLTTLATLDEVAPVALVLELRAGSAPLALDVRVAGKTRFVALAPFTLQVNRLVELKVRGHPLSVWANVQRARKLGEVHELDFTLFAMSKETATAWATLLAQHGVQQAA